MWSDLVMSPDVGVQVQVIAVTNVAFLALGYTESIFFWLFWLSHVRCCGGNDKAKSERASSTSMIYYSHFSEIPGTQWGFKGPICLLTVSFWKDWCICWCEDWCEDVIMLDRYHACGVTPDQSSPIDGFKDGVQWLYITRNVILILFCNACLPWKPFGHLCMRLPQTAAHHDDWHTPVHRPAWVRRRRAQLYNLKSCESVMWPTWHPKHFFNLVCLFLEMHGRMEKNRPQHPGQLWTIQPINLFHPKMFRLCLKEIIGFMNEIGFHIKFVWKQKK